MAADRAALELAVKKNLFATRGENGQVTVPPDLTDLVEAGARPAVDRSDRVCRAKAGEAVAGFEKVKDWLATKQVKVLLQATDGSERGKSKLWTPTGPPATSAS